MCPFPQAQEDTESAVLRGGTRDPPVLRLLSYPSGRCSCFCPHEELPRYLTPLRYGMLGRGRKHGVCYLGSGGFIYRIEPHEVFATSQNRYLQMVYTIWLIVGMCSNRRSRLAHSNYSTAADHWWSCTYEVGSLFEYWLVYLTCFHPCSQMYVRM